MVSAELVVYTLLLAGFEADDSRTCGADRCSEKCKP